jgi:hypothetical protein
VKRKIVQSLSGFDEAAYINLVKRVGSMSQLFSDNDAPYIVSRFAERLFVFTTDGTDLARDDMSFDALIKERVGVGVKTFQRGSTTPGIKSEKVAEYTADATQGRFKSLSQEDLALEAAKLRNLRVRSDAAEYSIDLNGSIYHCLVRVPGGAIVHEEPYSLIELDKISATDSNGKVVGKFPTSAGGHVHFTDGTHKYTFNVSKNVLFKAFDTSKYFNSDLIPIPIEEDILSRIAGEGAISAKPKKTLILAKSVRSRARFEEPEENVPNTSKANEIVLPLYSIKSKEVAPKSGINQWNAAGRPRTFGESYIPIPKWIHETFKGFLPPTNKKFRLKLPNGRIISAKVCQEGGKALMSDPNVDLCEWLYSVIDGDYQTAQRRLARKDPYTYRDLVNIGKDSVRLAKCETGEADFVLSVLPIGSYANFAGISPVPVEF